MKKGGSPNVKPNLDGDYARKSGRADPSGRGDVQLIDVRELDEYKEGHIPGVKLIPLSQLEVRHDETSAAKTRS
ncbi:rhodanese-like domain-containing protein [Paenibacillus sp. JTLBN-2024]